MGKRKLAEQLKISEQEAAGYLNSYHGNYPGFKRLYQHMEKVAREQGYIELWTGRKRHFNTPKARPNTAMPNLIQGDVGEVMRVATSRLFPAIQDLGGYLVLQVHDSLTFEVPDENVNLAMTVIKGIMEDYWFDPKMEIDIEYGRCWGKLQKYTGGTISPEMLTAM